MDNSRTDATAAEGAPPTAYRPGRSPFRRAPQEPLHERIVPVSARIPEYRPTTARRDLIAGLTVAALAFPSAMAYAAREPVRAGNRGSDARRRPRAGSAPGTPDRRRALDRGRGSPQCTAAGRGARLGRPPGPLGERGAPPLGARHTGVVVYRLDDRLFFANARYVKGRVREALRGAPDESHWLVFDAEALSHVDSTGVEALRELAVALPRDGVGLVMARTKPSVHRVLVAGGVAEAIGEDRFLPTVRVAVAACRERDNAHPRSPA